MFTFSVSELLSIGYLAVAALLIIVAELRSRREPTLDRFLVVVFGCLWPLILLAGCLIFALEWYENRKHRITIAKRRKTYEANLFYITPDADINTAAIASIKEGFSELAKDKIIHYRAESFVLELIEALNPRVEEEGVLYSRGAVDAPLFSRASRNFSPYEGWHFGFSKRFVQEAQQLDKNMQGRIFTAMTKIAEAPMQPVGDTVKPLSENLEGLWRFRIGDYRLIYFPESAQRRITLVAIASRGSVYS